LDSSYRVRVDGIGLILTMAASPAVAERIHLDSFYFVNAMGLFAAFYSCHGFSIAHGS